MKTEICRYCGREITKARVPERIGGRVWRWDAGEGFFYCRQAGGDGWHEPK